MPAGKGKIVIVAGARPNFMKVAPLVHALQDRPGAPDFCLVHTGQHYDEKMSEVFFRELGIPDPDVHLGVGGGSHGQQTGRILERFEALLANDLPDARGVVVVGDVNSTVACALAAAKLQIPVAHVEAGLRSFDRTMPEETNRIVTDAISDLLLVSEPAGEANLRREGVAEARIRYVGNVMIDTLVRQLPKARAAAEHDPLVPADGRFGLVTLHRPSNVDEPKRLRAVMEALGHIASGLPLVFPAHPRTVSRLAETGLAGLGPGLELVEPLPYLRMLGLQSRATVVITDSGGMQEETSYLGVPCLTLRPNTERPVTTTLGTNTLVSGEPHELGGHVERILAGDYHAASQIPGWDGHAAERIVDVLREAWG
jgi:UDP-N-acetylglucosamine 2-epimerase (non-hydrolysing)